jgi:hypothetical protein
MGTLCKAAGVPIENCLIRGVQSANLGLNLERMEQLEALGVIEEQVRAKLRENSQPMKRAEENGWDTAILAEADSRMAEARELQGKSRNKLSALKATLTEEE